jgi:hypothetical protein
VRDKARSDERREAVTLCVCELQMMNISFLAVSSRLYYINTHPLQQRTRQSPLSPPRTPTRFSPSPRRLGRLVEAQVVDPFESKSLKLGFHVFPLYTSKVQFETKLMGIQYTTVNCKL